jgi:hypothetical protein
MTTGPGGASGATQPTELSLRAGSVEEGARPEPMTMLGLSVMLHGAAQFAIMNSDTTWYEREVAEGGFLEYMIPNVYAGGGLTVGYDVSGAIHWYETHLRLRTEFLAGAAGATGTKATVIPIELLVEKGFYVGRGLMLYGALGPNATLALVDVLPPDDPIPDKPVSVQHLQGVRFGGALNAGLEFLFSPNLAMRVEGNARINIPKTGYSTTDGGPIYWDFHKRSDSYSMVGGRLGVMAKF